ncbi:MULTISPECIES: UDP-N-acetylmuramoyl-L-alanine--D-glutamate ligase [Asticcacaulis]|uniref:UDP-N-acetylmuramoyl-L-alanine--D-glutamate ligase n=1 Tax=Asticcacaulis TaxID=76890 RepID=UPI001AE7924C|nr:MULTISPECIES: UDP-N-acetylmuramoyl-L-alanine--D-glutamate ligase [Asticcacaulis]MBP2157632.1 UDP-N-acetylmuramoylalanine--D-glutamate ligase [Asticcacaulis solisilvae]MDR6798677.1 UDP-N-acetylmuramoylalanine--D-glutamate ligase [Asticcacaulis sp. BE141]
MIPVKGFEGKRVAIFGLGRSGLSAARALKAGGAEPLLWDDKPASVMAATKERFTVENLKNTDWSEIDALMLSPGVPLTHPEPHWTVQMAKDASVPILGDIELFARTIAALPDRKRPKTVAITGTNGKSTTTALIGHILKAADKDVHVGGNIGIGILDLPSSMHSGSIYVIETSSYQLDLTLTFRPDVAVLMNFSPDHLDRHGGMDGYIAAKKRLFMNQTEAQVAVIGSDDDYSTRLISEMRAGHPVKLVPISSKRNVGEGVYAINGVLFDSSEGRARQIIDLKTVRTLTGRHNWQNAAAAYAACKALGLSSEAIVAGMRSFPGLAHRMQEIGRIGKVRFINDSKATNSDAARQAMSSYESFFWIAGGKAKAGGIEDLRDLFPRVKHAYLIGEAAELFEKTIGKTAPCTQSRHLFTAVAQAYAAAEKTGKEEVVLFSPACASFDQFADFEARGDAFRDAVDEISKSAAVSGAEVPAVTKT